MRASVLDAVKSHVPYDPVFMAKVALEAHSRPESAGEVARLYGLPEMIVLAWVRHLELAAVHLFSTLSISDSDQEPRLGNTSPDPRNAALDQMDVSIAVLEGDELRYRYANEAYTRAAPSPNVIGQRMREVFPASVSDGVEAGLLHVLRTGEAWDVKNFHAHVPGLGETIWEGKITRLPLVDGELPAVVVWIRDVTAAAQLESSLRQQIALLRAISDNSTDVMYAKNADGHMQFANPAALALLGQSLDNVIGKTDAEILSDKDAAHQVMANDRRIIETGNAEEVEEVVPLPDGTYRVWLSQKRPYINPAGQVVGLLGVSRDITERKSSEDRVRAAHDTLQRVLDSITDGLAIFDRDWNYTYLSDTGAKLLGVRSEDVVGKCLWDLFPHAAELSFGLQYRRAMETGVATHLEDFYPAPLNMWIECHCYPSQDGLSVYFRDVTDRRRAQDAAVANERRINALLEATPVGLAYADASGRILVMNGEAKRIWGSPPEARSIAAYGQYKGWWADQSEKHGQALSAHEWPTARALQGEHVLDVALEIEPFDTQGQRRLVLHRSVPILGNQGEIVGAVTAMTDITESTQMTRALAESDRRIRQLANTIPQLAWMADRDGAVNWYNDRWFDYTGRNEAEMVGWGWSLAHHPDVLPTVVQNWKYSVEHGTAFEMTFPLKGKDGLYRPFYTVAEPLKNLEGDVVQWFGTCTDVSALQRVQEDLTKTQHWLQEGLETGKMVAWEWDFDSDEIRYSDNALAVLGYGPGKSTDAFETVCEQDKIGYQIAMDRAIDERSEIDYTSRRIRPDNGQVAWVRSRGNVLVRADGTPYGIRGILMDVTEQVQREQAMEEASDRKDEFLAMLAHELRNPLAPIATAAHLLQVTGADPQRVKTSSEIIVRQIGHMTRLIDDLLDVSRVTRGLVELESEAVLIKDVVNSAIEQARPLIEARKHQLTMHIDSAPAVVRGDRVRLCQVVVNLLNNAAKYTPQGGKIGLDITVDADHVRLVIDDNGIGIDHQLLPHVFELFTQATRTPDRAQGGLGLGLALVESLVRMHNGEVEAFSEGSGKGSQFVVTLPILSQSDGDFDRGAPVTYAGAQGAGHRLSVLVVDDNIDAADMLSDILRFHGHTVLVEYTSTAALSAASERPCDVYVLDIGLPDIDGYELARQLRTMPANAHATFLALTGYGQAHDKVLSKSAGFDHHLVKPLDLVHLDSILSSLAHKS